MLTQISIKNFGLIDEVSLEFCPKLNILTGATGAGKSIIIDGLRFALGERMKTSQIRDEQRPCSVELVFEIKDQQLRQHEVLADYFTDEDSTLIIQRQYLPDGRNKVKVNGASITVSQLKETGNLLIDFHGPHDHQMLLSEECHLGILDQMADLGKSFEKYTDLYQEYIRIQSKIKEIKDMAESREREMDLLSHQIKELEQVPLTEESYAELCQAQVRVDNSVKLFESASTILQLLEQNDLGVNELIEKCFPPMRQLNQVDEKTSDFESQLNNLQEGCGQLCTEMREYLDSLSFSPEEAQEISLRFDIYENIKRKYGSSMTEASMFFERAKERFDLLNNLEANDQELKRTLVSKEQELKKAAELLTKARGKTAVLLKKTIEKELKDLGIEHVEFEARISPSGFHAQGQDRVVFYISPNAGEALKPLADIVSSGEAARLMLALKKALTKVDPIPVLIFDEIDAQIGGRLGTIIGRKLKEISADRQVLLITHLPQIASFADVHYKVNKKVVNGRTVTLVDGLEGQERIQELTQMMGAANENEVSKSHAEEMLASAQKFD